MTTMIVEIKSERYHATYILRVWTGRQAHEQRFRLEDLHSGHSLVFHSAVELSDYLRRELPPPAEPSLPSDESF